MVFSSVSIVIPDQILSALSSATTITASSSDSDSNATDVFLSLQKQKWPTFTFTKHKQQQMQIGKSPSIKDPHRFSLSELFFQPTEERQVLDKHLTESSGQPFWTICSPLLCRVLDIAALLHPEGPWKAYADSTALSLFVNDRKQKKIVPVTFMHELQKWLCCPSASVGGRTENKECLELLLLPVRKTNSLSAYVKAQVRLRNQLLNPYLSYLEHEKRRQELEERDRVLALRTPKVLNGKTNKRPPTPALKPQDALKQQSSSSLLNASTSKPPSTFGINKNESAETTSFLQESTSSFLQESSEVPVQFVSVTTTKQNPTTNKPSVEKTPPPNKVSVTTTKQNPKSNEQSVVQAPTHRQVPTRALARVQNTAKSAPNKVSVTTKQNPTSNESVVETSSMVAPESLNEAMQDIANSAPNNSESISNKSKPYNTDTYTTLASVPNDDTLPSTTAAKDNESVASVSSKSISSLPPVPRPRMLVSQEEDDDDEDDDKLPNTEIAQPPLQLDFSILDNICLTDEIAAAKEKAPEHLIKQPLVTNTARTTVAPSPTRPIIEIDDDDDDDDDA